MKGPCCQQHMLGELGSCTGPSMGAQGSSHMCSTEQQGGCCMVQGSLLTGVLTGDTFQLASMLGLCRLQLMPHRMPR